MRNATQLKHVMIEAHIKRALSSRQARSKDFYDEQMKERNYFYVLDSKGQVFLEECKHRNFVTCLKDVVFLNMLYRLQRPNRTGLFPEIPFVSPCGTERNFMSTQDAHSAYCFSKLVPNDNVNDANSSKQNNPETSLLFVGGSSLNQSFDPTLLSVDCCTGYFYHRITNHRYLQGQLGLLHPTITEKLSSKISFSDLSATFQLNWNGEIFPIEEIPSKK